jgi:hypothetical protein
LILLDTFGGGVKALLVSDEAAYPAACLPAEKLLRTRGFRAERVVFGADDPPDTAGASRLLVHEDARVLIAAGGESVRDMVKYAAFKRKLPYITVMSDFSGGALSPFPALYRGKFAGVFATRPPIALIADTDILNRAGAAARISALAAIAAKDIALTDWYIAHIIRGEAYCPETARAAGVLVGRANALLRTGAAGEAGARQLTDIAVRLSFLEQWTGGSRLSNGGETHTARCMELLLCAAGRRVKGRGENLFLAAAALSRVYRTFTARDVSAVFRPPPDLNLRAERMAKVFNIDESEALRRLKPCPDWAESRITRHKFGEYAGDFSALIGGAETRLTEALKHFKRAYPDAGFWIKGYFSAAEYGVCMALAPELSPKYTFLTHLRDEGVSDRYLI